MAEANPSVDSGEWYVEHTERSQSVSQWTKIPDFPEFGACFRV